MSIVSAAAATCISLTCCTSSSACTTDTATAVAVSGDYAYVADGAAGLVVVNISDPTNPVRVGGNTGFPAVGLVIGTDRVCVAAGQDGLVIVHLFEGMVETPSVQLEVGVLETDGTFRLRITGAAGLIGRVQRASQLGDWTDWQSVTLEATPVELADTDPNSSEARFYRFISP